MSKIYQYVLDVYPEEKFPPYNELSVGVTWTISSGYIIVALTDDNAQTLIHELGHCVWSIMRTCGLEDEETFCYLLEYIYKKITND